MRGKSYLYLWLTLQWIAMLPAAAALSYLFYSDAHGLPTAGFYVCLLLTFGFITIGYAAALRTLSTWQEGT